MARGLPFTSLLPNVMEKRFIAIVCFLSLLAAPSFAEGYPMISEDGGQYYLYKVRKSEGFYSIGKRFSVTRDEIVAANPEAAEGLKLGQTLKIPVNSENMTLTAEDLAEEKEPEYYVADSGRTHKVKRKETLYGISQKYGVAVDDILELNPEAIDLKMGMVLKIPVRLEKTASAAGSEDASLLFADEGSKIEAEKDKTSADNKYFPTEYYEKKKSEREQRRHGRGTPTITTEKDGVTTSYDYADGRVIASDSSSVVAEGESEGDDFSFLFSEKAEEPLPPKEPQTKLRAAILLPFSLDSIERDKNMDRFVDFYRGCIIAADSLKNTGKNITIDAYDIGKTSSELGAVLSEPGLQKADIIIGPAYPSQLYYVADFASQHSIPLIVPFANSVDGIEDNPNLFQIITRPKQLYGAMAERFCKEFSGKTVYIVRPDSIGITYDKREFTDLLMPEMDKDGMAYRYVKNDGFQEIVDSIARIPDSVYMEYGETSVMEKDVLLLLPTTNRAELMRLSEHLSRITASNVSLFGFAEWDGYQLKELYQKPLYMFNSYNQQIDNPRVRNFYYRYNARFGAPATQSKPSFAMMGYDNFMYFASAWFDAGKNFGRYLPDRQMLQMNYSFERQQDGGYVNTGTYLYLYNAEGISEIR